MNDFPELPRLYTALAEFWACLIYLLPMKGRVRGRKLLAACGGFFLFQSTFLLVTGELSLVFWIPGMVAAVVWMFLFLWRCGNVPPRDGGYYTIQAFVLAELAASLAWQLSCFLWPGGGSPGARGLLCVGVYTPLFVGMGLLISRYIPTHKGMGITGKEWCSALLIGITVFSVSNLSFVSSQTPFSGQDGQGAFAIRTLVDLGGVAVLFAHWMQCGELRMRRELAAMQHMLEYQYLHYQQSKETMALIHQKYHDLKHQIVLLREEADQERRKGYLDRMEEEIQQYEGESRTGNGVLDTIVTQKSLYCIRHHITFTSVLDGTLLQFMDVMDLCTMIGNGLDNAIECQERVEERERRLIHMTLSEQRGFVLLQIENYCEDQLEFEDQLPKTTKGSTDIHGYGLKSIRHVVESYGGSMTVRHRVPWFELNILFPRSEGRREEGELCNLPG